MGHTQDTCYSLHGFLEKRQLSPTNNQAQSSSSTIVLIACISQSTNSQSACDNIFGNDSLFSSMSHPKFSHCITLTNETKVSSKGI
ncbi:hypothetical protein CR513_57150, partial [Mucuna pruriens]